MGGMIGHVVTDNIYKYSFQENEWSLFASLPEPLADIGACVYKDVIYVSGGRHTPATGFFQPNDLCRGFSRFDTKAGTFESLQEMPQPYHTHNMMATNKEVLVMPASLTHLTIDQVMVYTTSSKMWTIPVGECRVSLRRNMPCYAEELVRHGNTLYFVSTCGNIIKDSAINRRLRKATLTTDGDKIINLARLCDLPQSVLCTSACLLTIPQWHKARVTQPPLVSHQHQSFNQSQGHTTSFGKSSRSII